MFVSIGQDAAHNIAYSSGEGTNGASVLSSPCAVTTTGLTAKAMMDCWFTPSYSFLGNVLGFLQDLFTLSCPFQDSLFNM